VAAHKRFESPESNIYMPLRVGAEGNDTFGYQADNEGDNISKKNVSYCELTGMYWMWKNVSADIIGLVHYRRYFYRKLFSLNKKKILNRDEIEDLLKKYDVIVPLRGFTYRWGTVTDQYLSGHLYQDLETTEKVIEEKYPDYLESYKSIMNGKYCVQYNMVISNKEIYDQYCEWLFTILFEVEKRVQIPIEERDAYNKRVYGFLSERLFNVWLHKHNDLKICELPVYNTEGKSIQEHVNVLIKKLFLIRGKKIFKD
jgi:hypothetical protein